MAGSGSLILATLPPATGRGQSAEIRNPTMKTITLSHDAFARQSTVRQKATGTCAWCGQPAKFRYGVESDAIGAKANMQRHVFCSRSCERSFNH